ncbi:MAG: 4-(cytidine 5'-diphospho)-2-C-methyl-D-erythritol kinase [Actinobacteria bacterium]|nr:4-(cytidine 5'-diphospho)-2-C-methyl-D-erythritol kinase [Actinomycetota bacterium]
MRASAAAKINLALVVGPKRDDDKHEVVTVYQRIGIADRLDVVEAADLLVEGFPGDTLVRGALEALAERAGVRPGWHVRIEKRLPVAAGIGGGSSDAATALRLANATLPQPLGDDDLRELAAGIGADVPFFLVDGPQLGTGDGTQLAPLDLPQDFWVLLVVPRAVQKPSTAAVYADFDVRAGHVGFEERRAVLLDALGSVRRPRDLAALPPNDLATSPISAELSGLGAFRADVSGAGPSVYGLFHHKPQAKAAQRVLKRSGDTWLTAPAWYG